MDNEPTRGERPGNAADMAADLGLTVQRVRSGLLGWSGGRLTEEPRLRAATRAHANDLMDAIDESLRDLHEIRRRLVGEIRAFDDETVRRVDEFLARRAADAPRLDARIEVQP